MKRDMNLIRGMLLEIEAAPIGSVYETDASSLEADGETLAAHLLLMDQAGFLIGYAREADGNAQCDGLTWQGHEFLNAARSDRVWRRAKQTLREQGLCISADVLKSLLSQTAARMLGLDET